MIELSSAYHACKLASRKTKGADRLAFQLVSGVLMAIMGGKVALEALGKMPARSRMRAVEAGGNHANHGFRDR